MLYHTYFAWVSFIPASWFILLWLQQGLGTEPLRTKEALWEACFRPDEHCVKIRELFCNGREEIVFGFHSSCQPQLCGDFFTDAKLTQSYETRPEHTHPFSGLCNPTSTCI